MNTSSTSRRAALGVFLKTAAMGASVPILAASVSQCSQPAHSAAIERSAWDQAFSKMEVARNANEAFRPIVDDAWIGYLRDKPSGDDIDLRPMGPLITADFRNELLHRADPDKIHADFIAAQGVTWWAPEPSEVIARHKAACERIREFRAQIQAVKDRHDYDAKTKKADELGEADHDATWALFDIPAPDLAALRWKIEHLFGHCEDCEVDSWSTEVMKVFLADVRRLLPEAA